MMLGAMAVHKTVVRARVDLEDLERMRKDRELISIRPHVPTCRKVLVGLAVDQSFGGSLLL